MYLRESRQKRADGSVLTHLQLAASVWNAARGQSEIRIVYNCGRADDPALIERLRALARSILRRLNLDVDIVFYETTSLHFWIDCVVHSNDDTLSAEDMALGYKQQQRVEEAWRTLKSGLRLRPMFHWAPHRIHANVALSVVALLLERAAEHACGDTWRNIRDDLKTVKLAQLLSPHGTVWQVTDSSQKSANRRKTLRIRTPALIQSLA